MGRRNFISTSLINRMLASSRAEKRREENRQLIQAQNGPKELEPEYSIDYIDFNEQSRSTKIHFRKTVHYRTIDRYVQQNYERYPIYSGWKTKTSSFTKSIKLTNEELENLYQNTDEFLRDFAVEIITKLPEELTPSWYIKESIDTDYIQKINAQEDLTKSAHTELQNNLQNNNKKIAEIKQTISLKNNEKGKIKLKVTKLSEKVNNAEKRKKNLLLSVVTLFIYSYLRSEKRISKLISKKK